MQVQAISPKVGFTSSRKRDDMIAQDDKTIRMMAANKSLKRIDVEKNRKVTNALFYSIPVVAGIASAILNKKTNVLGKEITGKAGRLAAGLKSTLGWGLTLGLANAIIGTKNLLHKKSDTVREFDNKNPVLSFFGTIGVALAALIYAPKGIAKLVSKIKPETMEKATTKIGKYAQKINKMKLPKFVVSANKWLVEKTPSAIKETGKTVVSFAPDAMLIGTLLHAISSNHRYSSEYSNNYSRMKEKQMNIAKMRVRELEVENSFLKQFPENEENLATLREPLNDLPEEVLEKVAELVERRAAETAEADV